MLTPTPLTEKAWFLSENTSYSTLEALEKQEEAHAATLASVANTPAPEPVGSKIMNMLAAQQQQQSDHNDDDTAMTARDSVARLRRRRRNHRVGATTATGRSTRDGAPSPPHGDDSSSSNTTSVGTRAERERGVMESSFDYDQSVDISLSRGTGDDSAFSMMEGEDDESAIVGRTMFHDD